MSAAALLCAAALGFRIHEPETGEERRLQDDFDTYSGTPNFCDSDCAQDNIPFLASCDKNCDQLWGCDAACGNGGGLNPCNDGVTLVPTLKASCDEGCDSTGVMGPPCYDACDEVPGLMSSCECAASPRCLPSPRAPPPL